MKKTLYDKVNEARNKHINSLVKNIIIDPMLDLDDKDLIEKEMHSLLWDLIQKDGTVALGLYLSIRRYMNYDKENTK